MRALLVLLLLIPAVAAAADVDSLLSDAGMAELEIAELRARIDALPAGARACLAAQPATACVAGAEGEHRRVLLVVAGLEQMLGGDPPGAASTLLEAGGDDVLGVIVDSTAAVATSVSDPVAAARLNLTAITNAARHLGPEHPYVALLQLNQAWFAYHSGDQPGVLNACAVAVRDPDAEALDSAPGALCRSWIGALAFQEGRYGDAEALWLAALAWYDANVEATSPDRIVVLGNLGRSATEGGRPAEGIPRFEAAVEAAATAYGATSAQVSTYRWFLADALTRAGQPAAAVDEYERIVAERTATFGAESQETIQAVEWLASAQQKRGRYAAAERGLERALRWVDATQGPAWRASTSGKLAELYREMGRFDAARPLAARAVALAEEASGPDSADVASYLLNEGNLLRTMGDLAGAKVRYERALAAFEAALGPEHQFVATALTNVAGLAADLGDRAAARPMLERAVAIYEAVLPADHEFVANAHNNVGAFLLGDGEAEAAVPHLLRAAEIWERALGPGHPSTLVCWQNLAQALFGLGRPVDAANLLGAAADRAEQRLGKQHHAAAQVRTQHAEAVSNAGDQATAAALYAAAVPRLERALGPEHPSLARTLTDLARVQRLLGKEKEARALVQRVDGIVQATVLPLLDATSERERLRLLQGLRHHADLALSILDRPDDAAATWSLVRSWKGAVLGSLRAQRAVARGSTDPALQEAAAELTVVRQGLAEVVFGATGTDRSAEVATLTARKEELERTLARAGGDRPEVSTEALCATLDANEALVDFVRYTRRGAAVTDGGQRREADPIPSYAAFVLRGGDCAAPTRLELGPAEPIDVAVRAWRRSATAGRSLDKRGGELARLLWEPLAPLLGERDHVLLVPDGALSSLPFGALPTGDGFLVEQLTITYLGTTADLLAPTPRSGRGALVVGGVDYGAATPVATDALATRSPPRGGLPLSFLPGTAAEAEEVAATLGPKTLHLAGAEASEARIRAALPGRRIAHIATHGFFAAPDADTGIAAPGSEAVLRAAPMLRTGLVLAGAASTSPRPGGDDGLLTAEEVLGLDLAGLELVVLSACETGLGQVEGGEGVMGMRRAFSLAGAGTLVLSLWKVPDEPTRLLMADLYAALDEGASPAEALRAAQIARITAARDAGAAAAPRDWAAFVASGR